MTRHLHDGEHTRFVRTIHRADLRAVPETRHALRALLAHWGKPGRSETAELLATELVTNALVHTGGDAVIVATLVSETLYVEVRDFATGLPKQREADPENAVDGRGLTLVQSLADAWGVRGAGAGDSGGKVVWFELEAGGD